MTLTIDDILNDLDNNPILSEQLGMNDLNSDIFIGEDHPLYSSSKKRKGYDGFDHEVTDRCKACQDFKEYRQDIMALLTDFKEKTPLYFKPSKDDIAVGTNIVFNGLAGTIVAISQSELRKSGVNTRVKIVYVNGNESNLLVSSLMSKFSKEGNLAVKFS